MPKFPLYTQYDAMDCGPTCLRMVAKYYGRVFSAQDLRNRTQIGKEGVSLLGISEAAESIGFKSLAIKVTLAKLINEAPLPCIVHWNQNHFITIYKANQSAVFVADPAAGLLQYITAEFESRWATTVTDGEKTGIALLLEPTPKFYEDEPIDGINQDKKTKGFSFLFQYLDSLLDIE